MLFNQKKNILLLFNDYKSLKFSSKLISFLPVAIILGPLISDGIVVITSLLFIFFSIKSNNFSFLKNNFFQFFLLFWIILILSSIFGYYPINSSEFISSFRSSFLFIRYGFFLMVIYYACLNEKKFLHIFRKITYFTLCFIIIHALFIYFFRFDFLKPQSFIFYNFENLYRSFDAVIMKYEHKLVWTDHRISGVFYDELVLGTYLFKIGLLYFALSLYKKDNVQNKRNSIIFISILIFTIFISGDRAPFLLASMGIIMIFTLLNLDRIQLIKFCSISFLIIFITIFFNPNLKDRFIDQITHQIKLENSKIKFLNKEIWYFSEGHSQHLITAINIFNDHKLLGTGTKTFRHICKEPKYNLNTYSCTTHPHNTYAQLLAETGIIGFVYVFGLFMTITFLMLKKKIFLRNEKNYNFNQSLLILFFLCLWPIIPSGSLFNNSVSIYNFLIIGFLAFSFKNNQTVK
jgi:O-antigen ligase